MPRHGNQTFIDIVQIKSEPIASDSPWLMLKLIEDQGCKHNDKKFGLFVRKLSFSRSKNGFFIFCSLGVINVWICCVESIPPGPLIKKFCLVRIGLIYLVLLARRQQRDPFVFESSCHLPTCLPHTVKTSLCPFYCWTTRCQLFNCCGIQKCLNSILFLLFCLFHQKFCFL